MEFFSLTGDESLYRPLDKVKLKEEMLSDENGNLLTSFRGGPCTPASYGRHSCAQLIADGITRYKALARKLCPWKWMKMDEKEWKWMKMDENGLIWMKMNENELNLQGVRCCLRRSRRWSRCWRTRCGHTASRSSCSADLRLKTRMTSVRQSRIWSFPILCFLFSWYSIRLQ